MQVTNSNRNQLKVGQYLRMELPNHGQFNANLEVVSIRKSKKHGLRVQVKSLGDGGACGDRDGTIVDFDYPGVMFYAE